MFHSCPARFVGTSQCKTSSWMGRVQPLVCAIVTFEEEENETFVFWFDQKSPFNTCYTVDIPGEKNHHCNNCHHLEWGGKIHFFLLELFDFLSDFSHLDLLLHLIFCTEPLEVGEHTNPSLHWVLGDTSVSNPESSKNVILHLDRVPPASVINPESSKNVGTDFTFG